MARSVYRYEPINETPDKGVGILLPLNRPVTGRLKEETSYDAAGTNGKGVFVQSYTTEEQSISNLRNLLHTLKGERFMQPNFGTRIREFLFRQSYESLASDLSESITNDINTWIPYIILDAVDVVTNEHRIDIRIRFRTTRNGANLIINVLAQENAIIVSEPIQDTYSPASSRLVQVYGGL